MSPTDVCLDERTLRVTLEFLSNKLRYGARFRCAAGIDGSGKLIAKASGCRWKATVFTGTAYVEHESVKILMQDRDEEADWMSHILYREQMRQLFADESLMYVAFPHGYEPFLACDICLASHGDFTLRSEPLHRYLLSQYREHLLQYRIIRGEAVDESPEEEVGDWLRVMYPYLYRKDPDKKI